MGWLRLGGGAKNAAARENADRIYPTKDMPPFS